jgi:hypothetical protein
VLGKPGGTTQTRNGQALSSAKRHIIKTSKFLYHPEETTKPAVGANTV